MIRRLYPYWRESSGTTALGFVLLIVGGGFAILLPRAMKGLVDSVFLQHPPPSWLAWLAPLGSAADKSWAILMVCLAILVLALLYKGAVLISQLLLIRAGNETVERLRNSVCERLLQLSLS